MDTLNKSEEKRLKIKKLRDFVIEKKFREQYLRDSQSLWKNADEIRRILHPTLDHEEEREKALDSSGSNERE